MEVSSLNIEKYNKFCLHYDIISKSCYSYRRNMAHALSEDFFPYIISSLIVFDMQRQMGSGLKVKYDQSSNGFATRLGGVLKKYDAIFYDLEGLSIETIDLEKHATSIKILYEELAVNANLAEGGKAFHVGATKVMHFLHPALFPIIDSNSAAVLRDVFKVQFKNNGQPGYTKERYIECMKSIQEFVIKNNSDALQALEPDSPITRIFDKLAFVEGAGL